MRIKPGQGVVARGQLAFELQVVGLVEDRFEPGPGGEAFLDEVLAIEQRGGGQADTVAAELLGVVSEGGRIAADGLKEHERLVPVGFSGEAFTSGGRQARPCIEARHEFQQPIDLVAVVITER